MSDTNTMHAIGNVLVKRYLCPAFSFRADHSSLRIVMKNFVSLGVNSNGVKGSKFCIAGSFLQLNFDDSKGASDVLTCVHSAGRTPVSCPWFELESGCAAVGIFELLLAGAEVDHDAIHGMLVQPALGGGAIGGHVQDSDVLVI